MNNQRLLGKFTNDSIKIEEKLIKVRAIPNEGNSYRNLTSLYYESIKNVERYTDKDCDTIYLEDFYSKRKDIISNELVELEVITNNLLENDDFKEYKMFNQSFQDLVRIQDDVERLIRVNKSANEYDKLLKYSHKDSFIDKDLLFENVKRNSDNYNRDDKMCISVNFSRGNSRKDSSCVITEIVEDCNDIIISNIKTLTNMDFKQIYKYIKTNYSNVNKIILDTCGFGIAILAFIEEDEDLKTKLFKGRLITPNLTKVIDAFETDIIYNKIIFINHNFRYIENEILLLFNEMQNITLKDIENGFLRINTITNDYGKERLESILNYYNYKNSKESIDYIKLSEEEVANDIAQRMAKYEIIHGVFYKYMFKAIEKDSLSIKFYHNDYKKLLKFQSIMAEKQFMELFADKIKCISSGKSNLEIQFLNGSSIKFIYASSGARGNKYHYAVIDSNINEELYDYTILTNRVDYWMNGETQELGDNYRSRTEFLDFDC